MPPACNITANGGTSHTSKLTLKANDEGKRAVIPVLPRPLFPYLRAYGIIFLKITLVRIGPYGYSVECRPIYTMQLWPIKADP